MPRVCITVPGKNAQPYRFSLERKVVRLGRASDNDIVVDCASVSSHHCEMRRVPGGYILKDLKSTNGIKLDEDRMEIIDLKNGQEVTVGDADLDFELNGEEREELGKEDHKPQQRAQLPPVDVDDEEEEEEEDEKKEKRREKPRKKKKAPARERPTPAPSHPAQRSPAPLASTNQQSGALNFFITMSFLLLAAIALYLGLESAHRSKHGYKNPSLMKLWTDPEAELKSKEELKKEP